MQATAGSLPDARRPAGGGDDPGRRGDRLRRLSCGPRLHPGASRSSVRRQPFRHEPRGRGVEIRVKNVEIAEGRLRVQIVGRGAPVLCLHGVSARGQTWLPVALRLSERCELWLPDLLGRGTSTPRPDLRFTLADETRRAGELSRALQRLSGTGPPGVIAGHSQGAAIALSLAKDEASVRGLVLANPVTPWTRRPLALRTLDSGLMRRIGAGIFRPLRRPLAGVTLARVSGPAYRVTDEAVRSYSDPYGEPTRAETLMRVLADWRPAELRDRLPERPLRVRVIAGGHDPRVRLDSARRLAAHLRGELVVVEEGGHVLPEEAPETVAGAIRKVLEELEEAVDPWP